MNNPLHHLRHGQALWQVPQTPHPLFTTHADLMRYHQGGTKESFNIHLMIGVILGYILHSWIILMGIAVLACGEVFFHLYRKSYSPHDLRRLNLWRNWGYSGVIGALVILVLYRL